MRSWRATDDLVAVSANSRETAINTEQTLDTSLLVGSGTVINIEPRREDNKDEMSGNEEPSTVYDMGQTANTSFAFDKMQPQHAAFIMAFGLGSIDTAAAGSTGYDHTITPIAGDVDVRRSNPSFTSAMRFGKTVLKRRFASCFVSDFTMTFARDEWVKASANIKATGKVTDNVTKETVTALDNVTELTLAANGVEGSTAAERLQNIQYARVELTTGVWTEVEVTAVSDATPAVLTITDPGGSGDSVSYEIIYIPEESGWMTFPSRVTETPLRVSEVSLNVGGSWSGSAFSGGKTMRCEAKQVEWSFNNNLNVEFCFGEAGNYAGRAFRDGRTQTLKLDREFRDFLMQQHISDNDQFAVHIKAEGAEYEAGHKYTVELIFPLVQVLTAPISVDGKRLSESVELTVLQHGTYGSVIAKVKNKVATYAA